MNIFFALEHTPFSLFKISCLCTSFLSPGIFSRSSLCSSILLLISLKCSCSYCYLCYPLCSTCYIFILHSCSVPHVTSAVLSVLSLLHSFPCILCPCHPLFFLVAHFSSTSTILSCFVCVVNILLYHPPLCNYSLYSSKSLYICRYL